MAMHPAARSSDSGNPPQSTPTIGKFSLRKPRRHRAYRPRPRLSRPSHRASSARRRKYRDAVSSGRRPPTKSCDPRVRRCRRFSHRRANSSPLADEASATARPTSRTRSNNARHARECMNARKISTFESIRAFLLNLFPARRIELAPEEKSASVDRLPCRSDGGPPRRRPGRRTPRRPPATPGHEHPRN